MIRARSRVVLLAEPPCSSTTLSPMQRSRCRPARWSSGDWAERQSRMLGHRDRRSHRRLERREWTELRGIRQRRPGKGRALGDCRWDRGLCPRRRDASRPGGRWTTGTSMAMASRTLSSVPSMRISAAKTLAERKLRLASPTRARCCFAISRGDSADSRSALERISAIVMEVETLVCTAI